MANPWRLVDRVALDDTVAVIKTAAAKHGGNHVEVPRHQLLQIIPYNERSQYIFLPKRSIIHSGLEEER